LKKVFFSRWHQLIFLFGIQSVIFRFDNQLDNEVELPWSFIQRSRISNLTKVAFLDVNIHQENQTDLLFKVKS
jgi:hypothetical protein